MQGYGPPTNVLTESTGAEVALDGAAGLEVTQTNGLRLAHTCEEKNKYCRVPMSGPCCGVPCVTTRCGL